MENLDNKGIVRRFYEMINDGELERLDELLAPEFAEHEPVPVRASGREAPKRFFGMLRSAFPDACFVVQDLIAEGDRVAARVTFSGTHRGPFLGVAPSGHRVNVTFMDMMRVVGGKIVAHWGVADIFDALLELGALQPTHEAMPPPRIHPTAPMTPRQ